MGLGELSGTWLARQEGVGIFFAAARSAVYGHADMANCAQSWKLPSWNKAAGIATSCRSMPTGALVNRLHVTQLLQTVAIAVFEHLIDFASLSESILMLLSFACALRHSDHLAKPFKFALCRSATSNILHFSNRYPLSC